MPNYKRVSLSWQRKIIILATMKYTEAQTQEILKSPKHKAKIESAREYEKELRLYTEAQDDEELKNDSAFKNLCKKIETRIPKKSYERVLEFIEAPLAAVDLTNSLLVELYKVFQSKNAFFSHEIDSEAKNKQLKEIIKKLDVHNFIIETGKEVLKNKPNTIIVIDKDLQGVPYIVKVDSDRLIDADVKPDGTMSYICFLHSYDEEAKITRIAFYDSEVYKVYIHDPKRQTYTLEIETLHEMGVCPARRFLKNALNSKNNFKGKTPIATNIGKIREWQLFTIYRYYAKHYAAFPIIEKMKGKCGNSDCNNGWVPAPNPIYFDNGERRELPNVKCKACADIEGVGVGTTINIRPKQGDEDNGKGTFKFIAPEISGVKYLGEDLEKLAKEIRLKTVGISDVLTAEAVNADQVNDSVQSKESVLVNLKETFEEIYIWIIETSAKAYFLGNVAVTVYANLGTEFYLVTETEMQARFKYARDNGFPEAEVDAIYNQLITTKYKDNPDSALRMTLLKLIDPLPFATFDEVDKLRAAKVISEQEYIIKRRFVKFIDRLEYEQESIILFGNKLTLAQRIKKITDILNKYADEQIKINNPESIKPIDGGNGEV